MHKIAVAKDLGTHMHLFEIEAPAIANKAQAGQFPNFSLKKKQLIPGLQQLLISYPRFTA